MSAAPMEAMWDEGTGRGAGETELVVDVAGFEGPLDLLLHLARNQKVDLARISILKLAEQYLQFIGQARSMRLELAADYLVMAAWLAYLKSRLLIPRQKSDGGESGEDLATLLQYRLQRLEAIRDAAARLMNRNRLGRDVFARGLPETVAESHVSLYQASLYDLLTAYAAQRQRRAITSVSIAQRRVWSLKEARDVLTRLIGERRDWTALDSYLLAFVPTPEARATAIASTFAASLEMVREGMLEIRQDAPFSPLMMRAARRRAEGDPVHG